MPITSLIPVARRVSLGGRVFPVWEARLSDLADLQAWLDEEWGDPLGDALASLGEDASPEDVRSALEAAYHKAEKGPPIEGEESSFDLFRSPLGVGVFLAVALRRGTPDLSASEIVEIQAAMTDDEYSRARRVFFGVHPLEAANRALISIPGKRSGSRLSWGEAIDEVARTYCLTYPDVYAMTITEFTNARRAGKPIDHSQVSIPDGMTVQEAAKLLQQQRSGTKADSATAESNA